ncbi:MAG: ferrous iron transport protein A [Candidatus Aegiribacteria sp.]|nr:ferrous iron transport protein A [Candidatus Aegiribacteria sp.]
MHGQRNRVNSSYVELSELRPGQKARIIAVRGGRGFRERFSGMGLHIGSEMEVLQSTGSNGMILIKTGDTRLMIGHGMAHKILLQLE